MDPNIDAYFEKGGKWQEELKKLRVMISDCGLTEELKWRAPCYTFQKSSIVIIQGFQKYCALLFFKGALLKDPMGILKRTGENTQAGRQIRFTGTGEIVKMESIVKAYIYEAIFYIFPHPNNPKPGSPGLKNVWSRFSGEKD